MFDVGTQVYSLLSTTTAITDLVPTDNIYSVWPDTVTQFPSIIFDDTQNDINFQDNKPKGSHAVTKIDVFIKDDTPTPIATAICNAFRDAYWSCEYNELVPDPDASIRHRSLRFSRPLWDDNA